MDTPTVHNENGRINNPCPYNRALLLPVGTGRDSRRLIVWNYLNQI